MDHVYNASFTGSDLNFLFPVVGSLSPDWPDPRRPHLPAGQREVDRGEHLEEGQSEEAARRHRHRGRKLHDGALQKVDHSRPGVNAIKLPLFDVNAQDK
jgi:hypothetical protein